MPTRPTSQVSAERLWEVGELGAHEGDVGGLDGDSAAPRTHADADVGRGERSRVVTLSPTTAVGPETRTVR